MEIRIKAGNKFSSRYRQKRAAVRSGVSRAIQHFTSALLVVLCVSATALPTGITTSDQIRLSQPLTVQWRYLSELTIDLTPATDGQRIYLPLAAGAIISLDSSTGQLVWRTETGGELTAAPIADSRGVYVSSESKGAKEGPATSTGSLRAIARDSGVTLWLRPTAKPFQGALAANNDTIFGGTSDGKVFAVRKSDGEIRWERQVEAPLASRLTLVGARLYIGGEGGFLHALDQTTGKTLWRYQTRGAVRGGVAVGDGHVYVGSADGFVYALRESDGNLRWRARTGAGVQSVLSISDGILVASLDNFVYYLSASRGNRLWKRRLDGRLTAEPLATFEGALFTPLSGDNGVVLDLKNGKQLNSLPVGEDNNMAAAPIIAGKVLLITTRHGLLAFSHPQDTSKK
jgi:outer membrane protein assembly factor BamB